MVSRCLIICIMFIFSPLLKIEYTWRWDMEEGIHVYCDHIVHVLMFDGVVNGLDANHMVDWLVLQLDIIS